MIMIKKLCTISFILSVVSMLFNLLFFLAFVWFILSTEDDNSNSNTQEVRQDEVGRENSSDLMYKLRRNY